MSRRIAGCISCFICLTLLTCCAAVSSDDASSSSYDALTGVEGGAPVCEHRFGPYATVAEPSCLQPGVRARACLICGEEDLAEIPAAGHLEKRIPAVPPDCLRKGSTEGVICERCGRILTAVEEIQPLGHRNLYTVGEVEATDTENGYSGDVYCGICRTLVEKGRGIPAAGHRNLILQNKKEATCTEAGYTGDWYCPDCETVVAQGSEIPMIPHAYSMEAVAPLCESEGYTVLICTRCGDRSVSDRKPALGHEEDENGYCLRCGCSLYDRSGDFGELHYRKFLQEQNKKDVYDQDRAIRAYALLNGIPLVYRNDARYTSLYRSHDLCVTLCSFYDVSGVYPAKYYLYDIYVRDLSNIFTVNSRKAKQMHDLIASAEERTGGRAIVAVNGDYFINYEVCRVTLRNGEVLRAPENIVCDVCVLYNDGRLETCRASAFDYDAAVRAGAYQIWNFGPALLDADGNAGTVYDTRVYHDSIINDVHPRTAIGYVEPGHYMIVVVDGRQQDEDGTMLYGCTVPKLADLMRQLGCRAAYNLDGGDSSQAYMNGVDVRIDKTRDPQRVLCDIIVVCDLERPDG